MHGAVKLLFTLAEEAALYSEGEADETDNVEAMPVTKLTENYCQTLGVQEIILRIRMNTGGYAECMCSMWV